jgi:hypothetical protein
VAAALQCAFRIRFGTPGSNMILGLRGGWRARCCAAAHLLRACRPENPRPSPPFNPQSSTHRKTHRPTIDCIQPAPRKREWKVSNLRAENDKIKAKEAQEGGLTPGQAATLVRRARGERRIQPSCVRIGSGPASVRGQPPKPCGAQPQSSQSPFCPASQPLMPPTSRRWCYRHVPLSNRQPLATSFAPPRRSPNFPLPRTLLLPNLPPPTTYRLPDFPSSRCATSARWTR